MNLLSSERHIPQLDGIRGIAVSLVVLFHCFGGNDEQSIISNKSIRWFFNRGWSGVDLFFILSGFLIGGILLDNKIDRRFIGVFYYRRLLRIFPLYYLLVLVAFLSEGIQPDWPVYVTYLQNVPMALGQPVLHLLGVTWSLAVEEHFYLILPAMIALVRPQLIPVISGFILLSAILRAAVFLVGWDHAASFAYYFTFCRIDELMLGVAAAIIVRRAATLEVLSRSTVPFYVVLGTCFALLPIVSFFALKLAWVNTNIGIPVYFSMYVTFLLLAVCHSDSVVGHVTRLKPLMWVGQRAYSLYLFHISIMGVAAWLIGDGFASRFLALAGVLALAWVLWKLIERPLISLGHRTSYGGPKNDHVLSPGSRALES